MSPRLEHFGPQHVTSPAVEACITRPSRSRVIVLAGLAYCAAVITLAVATAQPEQRTPTGTTTEGQR
jgi:hypothetical protein